MRIRHVLGRDGTRRLLFSMAAANRGTQVAAILCVIVGAESFSETKRRGIVLFNRAKSPVCLRLHGSFPTESRLKGRKIAVLAA